MCILNLLEKGMHYMYTYMAMYMYVYFLRSIRRKLGTPGLTLNLVISCLGDFIQIGLA